MAGTGRDARLLPRSPGSRVYLPAHVTMNSSPPDFMPSLAPRRFSAPIMAGLIIVAVQAVAGVRHAASEHRWFHYTPYATPTAYRLNATVAGRPLTDAQVRQRYGLAFRGRVALTPEALQQIVIRSENGRTGTDAALVRLHVSKLGAPEEIWLWPQQ